MITITISYTELLLLVIAITAGTMLCSFWKGFWGGYKKQKIMREIADMLAEKITKGIHSRDK